MGIGKVRFHHATALPNQAAEIKLRAERRAGEMLKDKDKAPGGQPYQSTGNIMKPVETLADLGISKVQSHRWQLEAEIPEEKFEQFIAETKAASTISLERMKYRRGQHTSPVKVSVKPSHFTPLLYLSHAQTEGDALEYL